MHTGHRRENAEAVADGLRLAGAEAIVAVQSFSAPERAADLVDAATAEWGGWIPSFMLQGLRIGGRSAPWMRTGSKPA